MLIDRATLTSIPLHVISADEQVYMEWFVHRTAQKLSGVFKLAFWNVLLVQTSLSEPAVLHAVLSLGSIHRGQALDIATASGNRGATTGIFALQQYTRAITDLRCRMTDKSKLSTKVALITCAIFIQLEYLRGFYKTALTHLRHGLVMLEEILRTNGTVEDDNQDLVNKWIMQTFTTMVVQAKIFGQDIYHPHLFSLIGKRIRLVSEIFQSLSHARQSLERMFLRIMGLKSEHEQCTKPVMGNQSPSSELRHKEACASIQLDLDMWLRACERVICENEKTVPQSAASAVDRFAWKLLRVYHTLAQIMAAECFSSGPLATYTWENPSSLIQVSTVCSSFSAICPYSISSAALASQQCTNGRPHRSSATDNISKSITPLFDSIVAQCDVLFKMAFSPFIEASGLHQHPADRDTSHAIADIGWIPPIYYASIRSREPRIRSKAIQMLRLVPHREGIWDSLMAATIAEKVLGIEEGRQASSKQEHDLHKKAAVSSRPQDTASVLESQKCRLRDVRVELPEDPDGRLKLSYTVSRNGDNGWNLEQHLYDLRSSAWNKCPC